MTEEGLEPAELVRRRLRVIRDAQGISARQLGEMCAEAGMPHIDGNLIAGFENGRRRSVTIDELMMLALVLNTSPLSLFTDDEEDVMVGDLKLTASEVRNWVRGMAALPPQDQRVYRSLIDDMPADAALVSEVAQRAAEAAVQSMINHPSRSSNEEIAPLDILDVAEHLNPVTGEMDEVDAETVDESPRQ